MSTLKQDAKKNNACVCSSNEGLFINNRQLSLISAGIILTLFIVFMIGYFIGQHKIVESFTDQVEQESFADQIYTSLFMSNDKTASKELVEEDSDALNVLNNEKNEYLEEAEVISEVASIEKLEQAPAEIQKEYYAQLIGFGTEKAAQKFIQKLNQQGITVNLRKRQSKTAKGKTISWYQVVTEKYFDKEELRALVDRIEKTEKIKGAQIVSC